MEKMCILSLCILCLICVQAFGEVKVDPPKSFDESGKVVKVIDGDTVDVEIDGKVVRLRLIGINTPETKDPRRPVQCFGREASAQAKKLLEGKTVHLERDKSQQNRDKYSRLFRYVWTEDGALVTVHFPPPLTPSQG